MPCLLVIVVCHRSGCRELVSWASADVTVFLYCKVKVPYSNTNRIEVSEVYNTIHIVSLSAFTWYWMVLHFNEPMNKWFNNLLINEQLRNVQSNFSFMKHWPRFYTVNDFFQWKVSSLLNWYVCSITVGGLRVLCTFPFHTSFQELLGWGIHYLWWLCDRKHQQMDFSRSEPKCCLYFCTHTQSTKIKFVVSSFRELPQV